MIKSLLKQLSETLNLFPSLWLICFSSNSIVVSWAAPDLRTVNGEFLGFQISWRERSSLPALAGQVNTLQLRDPNLTRSESLTAPSWDCSVITSHQAQLAVKCNTQKQTSSSSFIYKLFASNRDYNDIFLSSSCEGGGGITVLKLKKKVLKTFSMLLLFQTCYLRAENLHTVFGLPPSR